MEVNALERFAAFQDRIEEQQNRLFGPLDETDIWRGPLAGLFRFDPRRPLTPNLEAIAQYLQPGDVFVDVGGGAGRVGLPMALRCRELISVEPSPAMRAEFNASATEGGVENARLVADDWLSAPSVEGDVVFTADVIYFIRDIEPFVRKMEAAARRRVIIALWSVPPPSRDSHLFRLVYGEEQAPSAGHPELLAALWEMGILPDVQVLPEPAWWETDLPSTREQAVQMVLDSVWLEPSDRQRARSAIETEFDGLFRPTPGGYLPLWRGPRPMKELLITWQTG